MRSGSCDCNGVYAWRERGHIGEQERGERKQGEEWNLMTGIVRNGRAGFVVIIVIRP